MIRFLFSDCICYSFNLVRDMCTMYSYTKPEVKVALINQELDYSIVNDEKLMLNFPDQLNLTDFQFICFSSSSFFFRTTYFLFSCCFGYEKNGTCFIDPKKLSEKI